MAWIIKAYTPVECEESDTYDSIEEAEIDLETYKFMQPENIYQIEQV